MLVDKKHVFVVVWALIRSFAARCVSPSAAENIHHLGVELAAMKAELRKVRNEL